MPRYPRLFIPDIPLHIVQRGHDRRPVFFDRSDYRYYLDNLTETKADLSIQVLAYCLMTNHVHLVLVPGEKPDSISKLMRVLAARQTRRINRLEARTGTLWDGRFKSSLIDTDNYLLCCCRYIDLNPVRASMVENPEDYEWSGFRSRSSGDFDGLLDSHTVFDQLGKTPTDRAIAYRRFVDEGTSSTELSLIRDAAQRNQLVGGCRFKSELEARSGRRLSTKSRGRPGKNGRK